MAGITDVEVRALIAKAKAPGPETKTDGTIPGLTLTVSKTGLGSWVLRYYAVGGKRKEMTIGQYPAWGANAARAEASELRRGVDQGVDVATEKQMANGWKLPAS